MWRQRVISLDAFVERRFFALGLIVLAFGLIVGDGLEPLVAYTPIFLALTMFTSALNTGVEDFRRILYSFRTIGMALCLLYVVTPVVTLGLTKLFFPNEPLLAAGQIFSSTLPVGITASVWTILAGGSLPLCLSLVVLTTLLSGIITPTLFGLIAGAHIQFQVWDLVLDLIKIVIIPVIIGVYVQEKEVAVVKKAKPVLQVFVKGYMLLIIAIYAAIMTPHMSVLGWGVLKVMASMFCQFAISSLLALTLWRKLPLADVTAIAFANSVRNMVGGTIIATSHFPTIVALPLIISLLLQNPMGTIIYKLFRRSASLIMKEDSKLLTK